MLSCLVYLHTEPRSAESYPRPLALFTPSFEESFERSLEGLVVPQSLSPVLLTADRCPRTCPDPVGVTAPYLPKLFRINTCKSLSKQAALTLFRSHTYEKQGGRGVLWLTNTLLGLGGQSGCLACPPRVFEQARCNPARARRVLGLNRVLAVHFLLGWLVLSNATGQAAARKARMPASVLRGQNAEACHCGATRNEISSCRPPCATARTGWESLRSLSRFDKCCC